MKIPDASKNLTVSSANNSLSVPSLGLPGKLGVPKSPLSSPQTPSSLPSPKYDWFQTNTMINIAIYTKWKHITKEHVVIVKHAEVFIILIERTSNEPWKSFSILTGNDIF